MRRANMKLFCIFKSFIFMSIMLFGGASNPAFAENYPTRPITIVVPFAAGGPTDVVARIVSRKLSDLLKVPVVVDNRGGAGGVLGTRFVQRAAPDGYTLVLGTASTHAVNPALMRNPPYDPVTDFVPVAMVGFSPIVIFVNPSSPAKTLNQLIELMRAAGANNSFGTAGAGTITHLTSEMFIKRAGVTATHVPYRGQAPALNDLLGNQLTFVMDSSAAITPHVLSGTIRALGIASKKRSPAMPDVPTMAEAGMPDFIASTWNVLFAPLGTPPAIVTVLNTAVNTALQDKEVARSLGDIGVELDPGDPAKVADFVRSQGDFWRPIALQSGVTLD